MVNNLKIAKYANCDPISDNINDPVIKSIIKYRNHPSILKIGEVCNSKQWSVFFFSHDKEQILKEILNLDSATASQGTDGFTKIIKDNANIFSDFILSGFNNSITTSIFSSSVKHAIITPVFKKGDKNLKENYRPVNVLPNVSKNKFLTFLFKTTMWYSWRLQHAVLPFIHAWKMEISGR